MTIPITEIPPNFCNFTTKSVYTHPDINAQNAGKTTLLNPGKIATLAKVAIVTSTK